MCEGPGRALACRGAARLGHGCPAAGQGRAELCPASASAAQARAFSCPETKHVGAASTSIVLKSEGVLRVGPPGYSKPAATSPTSSLDTRDSGVFMQIHAAKVFTSLLCCSFPLFTTFSQLGN